MFANNKIFDAMQASLAQMLPHQRSLEIDVNRIYDLLLSFQTTQLQQQHPNPLNRCGNRCFSQSDEDGITIEIVRRLGLSHGTFAEFGVGDGRENNTLALAALGWRGFWIGGESLAFDVLESDRFKFIQTWINRENVIEATAQGLAMLGNPVVDFLSLDLDGNDYYLIEKLLESGMRPKVYVVEYNAKFIPPMEFCIEYNPLHSWGGDDYFGASLSSFTKLFDRFDYTLICCNSHTGANAYFVENRYLDRFSDVPREIEKLYVGPRYFLANRHGHPVSTKTLQRILF